VSKFANNDRGAHDYPVATEGGSRPVTYDNVLESKVHHPYVCSEGTEQLGRTLTTHYIWSNVN
jgi:hypothetical protein